MKAGASKPEQRLVISRSDPSGVTGPTWTYSARLPFTEPTWSDNLAGSLMLSACQPWLPPVTSTACRLTTGLSSRGGC